MEHLKLLKFENKKININEIYFCYSLLENVLSREELGELSDKLYINLSNCILSRFSELLYNNRKEFLKKNGIISSINSENKLYLKSLERKIDSLIESKKNLNNKFHPIVDERVDLLINHFNSIVSNKIINFNFDVESQLMNERKNDVNKFLILSFNSLYDVLGVDFGTSDIDEYTLHTNIKYLNKYYRVLAVNNLQSIIHQFYESGDIKTLNSEYYKIAKNDNINNYNALSIEKDYKGINPYFTFLLTKFATYIEYLDMSFINSTSNIGENSKAQYDVIIDSVDELLSTQFSMLYYPQLSLKKMDILK